MAALAVSVAPALGIADPQAFRLLAEHLEGHADWTIFSSACLAGWLMGMLSWLIAGGRDTTSQILFIWLVGSIIGALGLHHVITGSVEMLAGAIVAPGIGWSQVLRFMAWTTMGNAAGGVAFAILVRQGLRMGSAARRTTRGAGHLAPAAAPSPEGLTHRDHV